MTATEVQLLMLILAEVRRVEALSPYRDAGDHPSEWGQRFTAIQNLPLIGAKVSGSWIGDDSAGRKARYRGLKSLESQGLVTLHAEYDRPGSHAKLTPAGRSVAEKIAAELKQD